MDTRARTGTPRYQALLQLLRTSDAIWTASRVFFDQWDISPSQFNVLNLLDSEPAGLSQTQLSLQLITHRSNVTGLIDRLETRGLVKRKDVAADRRAYRVILTDKGKTLLEGILPDYHRAAESIWEGLSTQRLSELVLDLQRALKNVESIAALSRRRSRDSGRRDPKEEHGP